LTAAVFIPIVGLFLIAMMFTTVLFGMIGNLLSTRYPDVWKSVGGSMLLQFAGVRRASFAEYVISGAFKELGDPQASRLCNLLRVLMAGTAIALVAFLAGGALS
jgi:hypothetical protein